MTRWCSGVRVDCTREDQWFEPPTRTRFGVSETCRGSACRGNILSKFGHGRASVDQLRIDKIKNPRRDKSKPIKYQVRYIDKSQKTVILRPFSEHVNSHNHQTVKCSYPHLSETRHLKYKYQQLKKIEPKQTVGLWEEVGVIHNFMPYVCMYSCYMCHVGINLLLLPRRKIYHPYLSATFRVRHVSQTDVFHVGLRGPLAGAHLYRHKDSVPTRIRYLVYPLPV